jgi:hypothetical protein
MTPPARVRVKRVVRDAAGDAVGAGAAVAEDRRPPLLEPVSR